MATAGERVQLLGPLLSSIKSFVPVLFFFFFELFTQLIDHIQKQFL